MSVMEDKKLHLFDWSPVGLLLFESVNATSEIPSDWICRLANDSACNLLGLLPLDGLTLDSLFPNPVDVSLANASTTNPANNPVDFFVSNAGKWLLASGSRMENRLSITLTDVTRQKEAAFTDNRMKRLYQSLSNSLSDHEIIIFDKNFNIVLTEGQPRFVRLHVEGELNGRNLPALFQENEFSFLGDFVSPIFGSGGNELEREVNGKFYKAKIYADAHDDEGQENIVGVLLLKDVTELNQKQREIALRMEQLDHSNRELESFAYVASHDLQEPLRKIKSFGERLSMKYRSLLDEEGQMYISRMSEATKRMERLLDDLLLFSRTTRREMGFEPTDLQKTLTDVLHDLDTDRAQAQLLIPDNLPVIEASPSQMHQLFQNILQNAFKFAKVGQKPVIRITCQAANGANLPQYKLIGDRRYCILEFADDGIGFEQENAERIFTIFQRLHGRTEYSGSGIGLAISKKIVDNYGGVITARGEVGTGAVFTVVLPYTQ